MLCFNSICSNTFVRGTFCDPIKEAYDQCNGRQLMKSKSLHLVIDEIIRSLKQQILYMN